MNRLRVTSVAAACSALAVVACLVGAASMGPSAEPAPGPSVSPISVRSVEHVSDASPRAAGHDAGKLPLTRFRLSANGDEKVNPDAFDYASASQGAGPLLLFLPATGAVPAEYQDFLRTAASQGYHVLGLDYWNQGRSVTRTCGTNPECYTALQRNRLDGSHASRFSDVNAQNSIQNRLQAALAYLRSHDPHAGWERYAGTDGIRWDRIVVAGHSQGGGESAYIAHVHHVQGALMFSSPVDTDNGVAASWMHHAGATSPSRLYGFDNAYDMYFDKIVGSWDQLGMGRHGGRRDGVAPTGSHELISTGDIGTPSQSHLRSVNDTTPRTRHGQPVYTDTWRWMLAQVRHPVAEGHSEA